MISLSPVTPPSSNTEYKDLLYISFFTRFCFSPQDLVSLFNFHNYDNLRHFAKKLDPRREGGEQRVSSLFRLPAHLSVPACPINALHSILYK